MSFSTVALSEILSPVNRGETPVAGKLYRQIGVRLWGEGAYEREAIDGAATQYQRLFQTKANDVIVNKIWARNGSVAVVPENLEDCYGSNEFPMFAPVREKLEPRYFYWMTKTKDFWSKCDEKSRGTSGKNRIRPERFLEIEIPLPPLEEQRRIVARIEELTVQIEEANNLTSQTRDETKELWTSILTQACSGGMTAGWVHTPPDVETAQQLLERISNNKWPGHAPSRKRRPMSLPSPPKIPLSWAIVETGELQERGAILDIQDGNHGSNYPRKSEFADEGVPFVTAHQIADGKVNISVAPKLPSERAARLRIGFAKAGDVLLTHNASVGGVAIAPPDAGDFLIGTSVTYWRCNSEALEPRYLYYFMQSEHFQRQLQFIMKQTTRNQVSVLKQVNLWICVPPLAEQRQIAVELVALHQRLESLKRLESESAVELDALLPAIVDRAFKGEL